MVLFLLFPEIPLFLIFAIPTYQPINVFLFVCLPISFLLSIVSFLKLKRVKPTKCPCCKNTISMHYDEYNRRFFQCDNCGYYEYHLPGMFFGLLGKIVKNKKPEIFCPYGKWKKNTEEPLHAIYYYEEDSHLRNCGSYYCAKCGYRPEGPKNNCKKYRKSGGSSSDSEGYSHSRSKSYCFVYSITRNEGKRWDRCLNCKHLDYQVKNKRWEEKITERVTGKIMDIAFGKNEDYLAYKRKRIEMERIQKKRIKTILYNYF